MQLATRELALALSEEDEPVDIPRPVDQKIVDLARIDYLDDETLADLRNFGVNSNRYNLYLAWRRRRVVRLSAQGFNYKEIADIIGIHPGTVGNDIKKIRELYEGTAKRDWVLLVEERLITLDSDIATLRGAFDVMMDTKNPRMIGNALQIMDRIERLEKHRDKLLGLDKAAGAAYEPVQKKLIVNLSYESDKQGVIDMGSGQAVALESGD